MAYSLLIIINFQKHCALRKLYRTNVSIQIFYRMRYVAAYLLAVLGGKASPSQNDIEKILSSVGIETDAEKLKKVISELNGKSIDELIASGMYLCVLCTLFC